MNKLKIFNKMDSFMSIKDAIPKLVEKKAEIIREKSEESLLNLKQVDSESEDAPDWDFKDQFDEDDDSFDPGYESPDLNDLKIGDDQNQKPNLEPYTKNCIIL